MRRRERCVQAESQSKGILLLGFSQYGAQLCSMKPVYQFGFGLRRAHTPLSETSTSDDDGGDEDNGTLVVCVLRVFKTKSKEFFEIQTSRRSMFSVFGWGLGSLWNIYYN